MMAFWLPEARQIEPGETTYGLSWPRTNGILPRCGEPLSNRVTEAYQQRGDADEARHCVHPWLFVSKNQRVTPGRQVHTHPSATYPQDFRRLAIDLRPPERIIAF